MPMMWGKGSQEFGKRLTYPVTKNIYLLIKLYHQYVTIKKTAANSRNSPPHIKALENLAW